MRLFKIVGIFILLVSSHAKAAQMVVSAHPEATKAGATILAKGGNAIDAAVAIQTVLGLVEPQSSGLGGGGFLLYYQAEDQQLTSWDARETAPRNIEPDVFLDEFGEPVTFYEAVVGGQSVGVPSMPLLLETVQHQYGQLNWPEVLQPGIELANKGFKITPRFHYLVSIDKHLVTQKPARDYFYELKGEKWVAKPIGYQLKNPDYAATLQRLADKGSQDFYRGQLAKEIVRKTIDENGALTLRDMKNYQVKSRPPICQAYRQYKVCSMGPPSAGGIALAAMLGILSHFDLSEYTSFDWQFAHLFAQAAKLATVDTDYYVADPKDMAVTSEVMLNSHYLAKRAALLSMDKRLDPKPGQLLEEQAATTSVERSFPSTTHFVVIDKHGNAVSMTSSIENVFGSRLMVRGFLLNNQLTDFSFSPTKEGRLEANSVAGNKRPRSSMTPTMIFAPDGSLYAVLGSPGGRRIIPYVAQTVIALIDWQLPIQMAIDLPKIVPNNGGILELEPHDEVESIKKQLIQLGHKVKERRQFSGLHGILITQDGLEGGADKRREGTVLTVS